MPNEATPDLDAVRREARTLARKAVRVLGQVLQSGEASQSTKVGAAMRILEIAFGKSLEENPDRGGSGDLDELLRSIAKEQDAARVTTNIKPDMNATPGARDAD